MWATFGNYWPVPACVYGNVGGGVAAVGYLLFCWTQVALKRISTPRWGFNAAIGNVVAIGIILFFVSPQARQALQFKTACCGLLLRLRR